jgi:hypothetical protein
MTDIYTDMDRLVDEREHLSKSIMLVLSILHKLEVIDQKDWTEAYKVVWSWLK